MFVRKKDGIYKVVLCRKRGKPVVLPSYSLIWWDTKENRTEKRDTELYKNKSWWGSNQDINDIPFEVWKSFTKSIDESWRLDLWVFIA